MPPKKFRCGAEGVMLPPAPLAGAEQVVLYSGRLFPGSELEQLILGMIAASPACSLALLKVSLCHLPCCKSEAYVLGIDNRNTYRSRQRFASTLTLLPANAQVPAVVWEGWCGRQHGFGWDFFCNHCNLFSWQWHYWYVVAAGLGFSAMTPDPFISRLRFPYLYQ